MTFPLINTRQSEIADAIALAGATNDEAIAKDVILSTLGQLYSNIIGAGGDLAALETLKTDMIKAAVIDGNMDTT